MLLKRVLVEAESEVLRVQLRSWHAAGDLLTSSSLAWVEVWRALRRAGVTDVETTGRRALSGVAEFEPGAGTWSFARRIGLVPLRSLDALHLAAAMQAGVQTVVTYDERLGDSAAVLGFEVVAPGATFTKVDL